MGTIHLCEELLLLIIIIYNNFIYFCVELLSDLWLIFFIITYISTISLHFVATTVLLSLDILYCGGIATFYNLIIIVWIKAWHQFLILWMVSCIILVSFRQRFMNWRFATSLGFTLSKYFIMSWYLAGLLRTQIFNCE